MTVAQTEAPTDVAAPDASGVDGAVASAESLLSMLGIDYDTEHTRRTAERMVASYRELLTPRPFEATTFPNDEQHLDWVISRAVPFASLCAHHMLPFIGTATVGYQPGARLLGLSKLARVVEMFACRLQVQEDLTQQIAGWLDETLPDHGGAGVVITAEHLCMTLRGAAARGATTVTTAWRGELARSASLRAEFLALAADR
ncbi:GTP cyclohydrolase I [Asanoa siamensis]|uniref:GTP cyclohydrolase 1 n=1 Tax=Asanoa siamensis TaxID=926357 RepID=A0ABQ4CY30_9ACTN|nr:GTP cyclohydrolase I [Asanoa siamensis]GIF76211.1 GTP cyclohydrolase 1 [Asanoa siamensis]